MVAEGLLRLAEKRRNGRILLVADHQSAGAGETIVLDNQVSQLAAVTAQQAFLIAKKGCRAGGIPGN